MTETHFMAGKFPQFELQWVVGLQRKAVLRFYSSNGSSPRPSQQVIMLFLSSLREVSDLNGGILDVEKSDIDCRHVKS
jgi:hypothetical protein